MSYDNSANSVRRLEERYERLMLLISDLQAAIGRLQQPQVNAAGSGGQGGGGAMIFQVTAANHTISISAASGSTPGSLSGVTISAITGGSEVTQGTGTVENPYAVATTTGKALTLGLNTDGSYTILGQSC